jgi:hypothetical protein
MLSSWVDAGVKKLIGAEFGDLGILWRKTQSQYMSIEFNIAVKYAYPLLLVLVESGATYPKQLRSSSQVG